MGADRGAKTASEGGKEGKYMATGEKKKGRAPNGHRGGDQAAERNGCVQKAPVHSRSNRCATASGTRKGPAQLCRLKKWRLCISDRKESTGTWGCGGDQPPSAPGVTQSSQPEAKPPDQKGVRKGEKNIPR